MKRTAVVVVAILMTALSGPAQPARAGHGGQTVDLASLLPGADSEAAAASVTPAPRYPWTIPRATADRPDEVEGHLVHVVYLLPSDKPDEALDTLGVLEDSVRSQNRWMAEQSGLRWRFDTFTFTATHGGTGEERTVTGVDVSFVRSELPAGELSDAFAVREELARLGFDDEQKRYLSYVVAGSGGVCGDALAPVLLGPDETGDGKYAQVYLDSTEGCGARGFAQDPLEPSFTEAIAQHELVHNDGMVRLGAPHNCAISVLHVCTGPLALYQGLDPEEPDLMYPFAGRPLADKVLDRGRDDYFGDLPYRGLEASSYLEPAATAGA